MKRLSAFIVIFLIFLGFIALNLQNKCDISLGFRVLPGVPVFLTALCSFLLGMLFTLPIAISSLGRQKKKLASPKAPKKSGKDGKDAVPALDEIKKEDSPYGID